MEELYRLIEDKISQSGCPLKIDGKEFYQDVSNEADEKENGSYLFLIKKSEDVVYEGTMDIMDDDFDLHIVKIHFNNEVYEIDFDA